MDSCDGVVLIPFSELPADHIEPGAIGELAEAQQERRILLLLLPALSLMTLLLSRLQVRRPSMAQV